MKQLVNSLNAQVSILGTDLQNKDKIINFLLEQSSTQWYFKKKKKKNQNYNENNKKYHVMMQLLMAGSVELSLTMNQICI